MCGISAQDRWRLRLWKARTSSGVRDELEIRLLDSAGHLVLPPLRQRVSFSHLETASLRARISLIPKQALLLQNYPNPFNPETWIPFQLSQAAEVQVAIYDVKGNVVRRLELGKREAGYYLTPTRAAHWDGRNAQGEKVASGVYFYELRAGTFRQVKKMVVEK